MPNKSDEQPERGRPESDSAPTGTGPGKSRLAILILALVIALLVAAYVSGTFHKVLSSGVLAFPRDATPVLSHAPPEAIISQENLLARVGAGASEDTKSAAVTSEGSLVSELERKPKSCPPGLTPPQRTEPSQTLSSEDAESPAKVQESAPKPTQKQATRPKPVDTPVIVTKEPEDQGSKDGKKVGAEASDSATTRVDPTAKSPLHENKELASDKGPKPHGSGPTREAAIRKTVEAEEKPQFQLPGSLKVHIHDYSGTPPKWGLMVIMDDSTSMSRKTKNWGASKMQSAETVIEGIAAGLTPGSKLAVRDFLCSKNEEKRPHKAPCLSRMLYEWAQSPYAELKEKIGHADSGGPTNPCAAAAYSLKKDFGGPDNLIPRIVLITNGASKCAGSEVTRALDQHKAKGKVGVDVVAIGMGKKRQGGYATLVKKTDGMLIKVDNPGDLEAGIARYVKMLRTPTMEKVEIRSDNAVFTTHPEEEITLPPGTYTVVLPVVAGLHPSRRTVPNVKINSGEANILDVRVRKGKPAIRLGKK